MAIDWNNPEQRSSALEIYYDMGYTLEFMPVPMRQGDALPEDYVLSSIDVIPEEGVSLDTLQDIDDAITQRILDTAWSRVRYDRDTRIALTDVWAMPDRTMTAEQIAYRQALRDITNQSDPNDITWPTKPE